MSSCRPAKTYGLPAFEGYGATVAAWVGGDSASVQGIIGVLRSLNCNLVLTYYGSFVADIEAEAGHSRGCRRGRKVDRGLRPAPGVLL